MDFLSRIQSKSSGVKTQYSFIIAMLITGVITAVWMSTLPSRLASISVSKPASGEDSEGLDDLFGKTKSQLGNIIDATKEDIADEVEATKSLDGLGETGSVESGTVENAFLPSATTSSSSALILVATSTPFASTSPEVVPEVKVPKMILIGTTTSQKVD